MNEPQALVRLQEIDLELIRLRAQLQKLPQLRKLEAIKRAQRKLSSDMNQIVGQRKDVQTEIADNEESTSRLNEHVAEVQAEANADGRTHRELANYEAQLTSLAKKLEKRSFDHKHLEESLTKLERAEANAQGLRDRLDQEYQTQLSSFQEQTADIRARVGELGEERKRVVGHLEPATLERYDAAAKRFDGLAVETLHGNKPSICRVALQPSDFGDIRRGGPICECPYCHRILVTGEDED